MSYNIANIAAYSKDIYIERIHIKPSNAAHFDQQLEVYR